MCALANQAKEIGALLESAYEQMTLALEGALEGLLEAYEEVERTQKEAEEVPALLRDCFSKVLERKKRQVFSRTVLPDGLRLRVANEYAKNTVCVDSYSLERGKLRDCAAGLVRRLELDAELVLALVRGLEEAASRLRRAPEVARRAVLRWARGLLGKEEALRELRRRAALRRVKAL
jgi:hypothetical protein